MKIAIIGAGFAGLATAYHLLQQNTSLQITLFDEMGVGAKASGMAAGLLHPFAGLRAKLNPFGKEAFASSCQLLEVSEKALGMPVFSSSSLLRLSTTESQEKDYLNCAHQNTGVNFLTRDECQKLVPFLSALPGILIFDAKTVYTINYLKGLFLALKNLGMTFEKNKIQNLKELDPFDKIIVTAGADTQNFYELQHLELSLVKGQTLELEWPQDLEPLPVPISSQIYIIMNQNGKSCIAGATYERSFSKEVPYSSFVNSSFAESFIMPKVIELIPKLKNAPILNCKAAIRVSTKDHLPLIQKINERLFVFAGLGSKGLLYHSFYAEKLAMLCLKSV